MVGVETKVLEIRPLQRISFFNDLYRSGFEAVVIDKGQENHMSMSLFSIIEKPKDTSEIVMNPSLVRSANQFYQALVQHQAFPQMQDLMCKELYGARLLVPVADPQKTTAVPVLTTGKGCLLYTSSWDESMSGSTRCSMHVPAVIRCSRGCTRSVPAVCLERDWARVSRSSVSFRRRRMI